MIKIFQKTVKEHRVRSIQRIKVGSWVYVVAPTEEEIKQLVSELGLEEGLIRDAVDPYESPRLEIKKDIMYIFLRFPLSKDREITTVPALIVVGEDFVTTISSVEFPFVDKFLKEKHHASLPADFSTTQKTKMLLLFLDEIDKQYEQFLIGIRRQVHSSQVSLQKISNKNIMQLVVLESALNDFLSALEPINSILQTLLTGKVLPLYAQDKDLTEDLLLSNGQLIEACKAKLKNIINVREAYSTIMSNNLNRIMHFFAALTIILTIPTIMGSLYGMNVPLPFGSSPFAFYGILGIALLISLILYVVFRRNRWV